MLFSYNWLQSYFKKKLPSPQKLAELLTLYSFEVEEVKKKDKDWVLDIDILPNRAHDCLSHLGVAREIGAIKNLAWESPISFTFKKPSTKEKISGPSFGSVSIKVKTKDCCPRYTAKVISGLKVKPSPLKIQKRLKVLGIQPRNNVVDILNYVMLETGQPLHGFDLEKIQGKEIIVRKGQRKEKIKTLEGKEYSLNSDILVISDQKDPLGIAGIKGGRKAKITSSTDTIVIESANFDPKTIRNARKELKLQTDASVRFEHRPDPNLTLPAVERAAQMINKFAGGEIIESTIDIYPNPSSPQKVRIDSSRIEKVLGIDLGQKEVIKVLGKLGFGTATLDSGKLEVEVPTFRQDISIPEDLIEEVARMIGYEEISPRFPKAALIPSERNLNIFWENFSKDVLKQLGFGEVYNYSFISKIAAQKFKIPKKDLIELENPQSAQYQYLRPSLLFNLLSRGQANLKHQERVKIFELGKIFKKKSQKSGKPGIEKRMLSGIIVGDKNDSISEVFWRLKGEMNAFLEKLGISDFGYDEFEPILEDSFTSIWQKGKSAEIEIGGEKVGLLGQINSDLLRKLDLPLNTLGFSFDFELLQQECSEEHEYVPLSYFPAAVRDVAVLVPRGVKVGEVIDLINRAGGKLLRDVDLFDIYQGENIPAGKKNLAFHLVFQAPDRTLSSSEINSLHQKIIKSLEKKSSWRVRKIKG